MRDDASAPRAGASPAVLAYIGGRRPARRARLVGSRCVRLDRRHGLGRCREPPALAARRCAGDPRRAAARSSRPAARRRGVTPRPRSSSRSCSSGVSRPASCCRQPSPSSPTRSSAQGTGGGRRSTSASTPCRFAAAWLVLRSAGAPGQPATAHRACRRRPGRDGRWPGLVYFLVNNALVSRRRSRCATPASRSARCSSRTSATRSSRHVAAARRSRRSSRSPWRPAPWLAAAAAAAAVRGLRNAAMSLEKEHQAIHDALTGLPNRKLPARGARPRRSPTRADRRRGRAVPARPRPVQGGQRHPRPPGRRPLLELVAERLQGVAAPEDIVARLGGDEFAVLLPDVAGRRAAPSRWPSGSGPRSPSRSSSTGMLLDVEAQHRHRAVPRPRPRRRAAAAPRRRRDVRRQGASAPASSLRRRRATATPPTGSACSASCARRSTQGELELHYQPKVDARRRAPSSVSRRWCAGATRRAGWCRRTSSSRSPSTPA